MDAVGSRAAAWHRACGMTGKGVSISPRLDPFRERQASDVAGRFLAERDVHRLRADLMWLGSLVLFSDHELRLLNDLGFLSQHDLDLLSQAGRKVVS